MYVGVRMKVLFFVAMLMPLVKAANPAPEPNKMEYPDPARHSRVEGKVILRATVAADGHVQGVTTISGDPMLAQPASENLATWQFPPTGRESEVTVRYLFRLTRAKRQGWYKSSVMHADKHGNVVVEAPPSVTFVPRQ